MQPPSLPKNKKKIVLFLAAVFAIPAGILGWVIFQDVLTVTATPKQLSSRSIVVAYASVQRGSNGTSAVIKEVWKDARPDATKPLVGTTLNSKGQEPPDVEGLILFFSEKWGRMQQSSVWFVRTGRVDDLRVSEFRTSLGL